MELYQWVFLQAYEEEGLIIINLFFYIYGAPPAAKKRHFARSYRKTGLLLTRGHVRDQVDIASCFTLVQPSYFTEEDSLFLKPSGRK